MTAIEAKRKGFTHHAKMYGFKGFYYDGGDDEHVTFQAEYWLSDKIVECLVYIEYAIGVNDCFPILICSKL